MKVKMVKIQSNRIHKHKTNELFLPELGSDEESGKDWSDLEREAAEEDRNYNTKEEFPIAKTNKPIHDRDRHRDKHKSSKNHRFVSCFEWLMKNQQRFGKFQTKFRQFDNHKMIPRNRIEKKNQFEKSP